MTFGSIPKFVVLAILAATIALALTGCGFFGNDSHNLKLTPGNWSIAAKSTNSANSFLVGGKLTQSGNGVSGSMYITGADPGCNINPAQAVAITGTVNGSNIALSSAAVSGQVITIAASGSGSSFTGTYSIAGGNCGGDQGKITANAVLSITGTWVGTVVVLGSNATMSVALTEATTPSADGTFALTGTVSYTGNTCYSTGTIAAASRTFGLNAPLTANVGDGTFDMSDAMLDSATAPKTIIGTYETSDSCATDGPQTVTLTKQ